MYKSTKQTIREWESTFRAVQHERCFCIYFRLKRDREFSSYATRIHSEMTSSSVQNRMREMENTILFSEIWRFRVSSTIFIELPQQWSVIVVSLCLCVYPYNCCTRIWIQKSCLDLDVFTMGFQFRKESTDFFCVVKNAF